jgi:aminopeptidase
VPSWLLDGMGSALQRGASRIAVYGHEPLSLLDADRPRAARASMARATASRWITEITRGLGVNWTAIPCPTPRWANALFPNDFGNVAQTKLWEALASAMRLEVEDPVRAWIEHGNVLRARAEFLNQRQYKGLHFRGPGTDLMVGLAEGHKWNGGTVTAGNGVDFLPNVPTEEIYTAPHRERISGIVLGTRPLIYRGELIEGICLQFEAGRVISASANIGEPALISLLNCDPGAAQLGEVALVPSSSPVGVAGLHFKNILLDENTASHLAFGQSFSAFFQRGRELTPADFYAAGGNNSTVHVDWMIGSRLMDVNAVQQDGTEERLMRAGEWVS